jgi:hypothetical protein
VADFEFNRGKFKELVLYLSECSADDEGFGMVKLNKLLYWCDFESHRALGRPMTGETYEKQEYGPVARDLPIVLDELAASGYVIWQRLPSGPYSRKVPTAKSEADLYQFSQAEIAIADRALEALAEHGGRAASEWSHEKSVGWNVAREYGDPISYDTAFISPDGIPPEDLKRAEGYVRERGWVTAE